MRPNGPLLRHHPSDVKSKAKSWSGETTDDAISFRQLQSILFSSFQTRAVHPSRLRQRMGFYLITSSLFLFVNSERIRSPLLMDPLASKDSVTTPVRYSPKSNSKLENHRSDFEVYELPFGSVVKTDHAVSTPVFHVGSIFPIDKPCRIWKVGK